MSDLNQPQGQNLSFTADAPPTQPQGSPEAPTLQNVQGAEELLRMLEDDQAPRELYAYFGAKSADDLAETDRGEFIRLANMSCEDRAKRDAAASAALLAALCEHHPGRDDDPPVDDPLERVAASVA